MDRLVEMHKVEANRDVQAFLMACIRKAAMKAGEPEPVIEFDESSRMSEKEALGRMLKTFLRLRLDLAHHKECVVQDRLCILARSADVHALCAHHPSTRQVTSRMFTPRGFALSLRRHGMVLSGEHERTIDGKRVAHLLPFDVEAIEEFCSRHVAAID
jgi:hypothetical protein